MQAFGRLLVAAKVSNSNGVNSNTYTFSVFSAFIAVSNSNGVNSN